MNKIMIRMVLVTIMIIAFGRSLAFSDGFSSHLWPEEGIFGSTGSNPYCEAVNERLLLSNYRKCQAVFLPSFSEESAVYIEYADNESNKPPTVVTTKMKKQLWVEMHKVIESNERSNRSYSTWAEVQRAALSKFQSVVNRSEAPIENKVASALDELWSLFLSQAHYPEKAYHGLDGETYHFANFVKGFGYHTGKAWSPPEDTPIYEFVEIAKTLREYSSLGKEDRKSAALDLLNRAQALSRRLSNNK